MKAGVRFVIAKNIEKIYGQNCQNIGLLTSTDFGLIPRVAAGETIPIGEFTKGLDPISASIVEHGGLFAYNQARLAGEVHAPTLTTAKRSMTLCEKIIASRAIADAKTGRLGVPAVQPGDALFVRTDVRFSHEYVTPMAEALFKMGLGDDAKVTDPASVFAFRDHLTFLDQIMPAAHIKMGLREQAASLATVQASFTKAQGIKLYGEVQRDGKDAGSEGICQNIVIEDLALPGQVVAGTDSHSCMAGVLGCFAFPRNGVPLRTLPKDLKIGIAYAGSCTGGKKADMDLYAATVRKALAKGRSIAEGVQCYIQFGSQKIRAYAETMGYVELFEGAGIHLIDPSCGACIKAGPGVSDRPDQVTVSAINRNFPGRSGPGQVYLASPPVVVASAFLGRIGSPDEL